ARQEEPGALAARGEGAARQLHRRPAPHPGPARPERRHGTGDPVGPRRTGRAAARRHPGPLPQGELIRAPAWPPSRHVDRRLIYAPGASATVDDDTEAGHPGGDVPGDPVQPGLVPLSYDLGNRPAASFIAVIALNGPR